MTTIEDFVRSTLRYNFSAQTYPYYLRSDFTQEEWNSMKVNASNEKLCEKKTRHVWVYVQETATLCLNARFKDSMTLCSGNNILGYTRQNFERPRDISVHDEGKTFNLKSVERIAVLKEKS